ncbi:MAG: hypothetical protein K0R44_2689 [Thermomicrobiales bacterium]|jgi:hypothetical protein|nr:hypothetical protein [Thermomicrobiales bacterium]
MSMQKQDPIQALRDAGVPVDAIPEEQRAALADLSEQEVNTLLDIHRRVEDAGEVQGYRGCTITGGVLF